MSKKVTVVTGAVENKVVRKDGTQVPLTPETKVKNGDVVHVKTPKRG